MPRWTDRTPTYSFPSLVGGLPDGSPDGLPDGFPDGLPVGFAEGLPDVWPLTSLDRLLARSMLGALGLIVSSTLVAASPDGWAWQILPSPATGSGFVVDTIVIFFFWHGCLV
jgi:hypothetical protein